MISDVTTAIEIGVVLIGQTLAVGFFVGRLNTTVQHLVMAVNEIKEQLKGMASFESRIRLLEHWRDKQEDRDA